MTVVVELADGKVEFFETKEYVIGKVKDFHPAICKVTIYVQGKKIKTISRPFKWFYKHFTFNSYKVQEALKKIENKEE